MLNSLSEPPRDTMPSVFSSRSNMDKWQNTIYSLPKLYILYSSAACCYLGADLLKKMTVGSDFGKVHAMNQASFVRAKAVSLNTIPFVLLCSPSSSLIGVLSAFQ
ncbi:hypothetical protein J3459_013551 [Metarhizium acridum]|uniref:uncharacterized protein n=1 Tax=Metarhizium acridum TaxID=92637 RepID=UPI001C6B882C|nr:hypothetical protein J3459_013551 [Metarhizium acridum]KAG8421760.1 hypothetical protein J3458_003606 [Metarhizium acridum]